MSFKYRFILSFVLLEIIFIVLIVSVNFITINSSSKKLTEEKIVTGVTFLEELLKVPVSIYDLATLDNILDKTQELKYINSVIVLDTQNRILSQKYNFKYEKIEEFLKHKNDRTYESGDNTYEIRYLDIIEEQNQIGSLYMVFDTSENTFFIQENKKNTILIVLLEIIISTFLSYIIGSRLTKMLSKLSVTAQKIGKNKFVKIPYKNKKDEIGILSNSMHEMQEDLKQQNNEVKKFTGLLEKQKEDLVSANKAKDQFLANMSHEIRTPLNAIIGFADILKDAQLKKSEKNYATIISKSANSLLDIINEILDFSKVESGKLEITPEVSSTKELFHDVHTLFESKASEKNITLEFHEDKSIPEYLIFDNTRMKQVISNLLSNAIKFTPEQGTVTLSTKLISKDDKQAKIYVEVKDTGIGIPKEKINLIFSPFSQADSSISKEFGGTGLGLTIISKILELMNSSIKVNSKKNKGSEFFFEIAFDLVEDQEKIEEKESKKECSLHLEGNILVAEDNPMNQQLMEVMLDMMNLKATYVNDGNEAVAKYKEENYDLIFMDINMPKCNGIEATKQIRELEKDSQHHTPIIALTANAIKGDEERFKNEGMDEHITKPINFDVLKEVIEKHLT